MAEYIEREAAYSLAKKVCEAVDSNPRVLLPQIILDLIDDLPAADVQPVRHGRWEKKWHIAFHQEVPCCSECHHFSPMRWFYCPNCGVKMEVDK